MSEQPGDDLVVSTPERVAFQYQVAGIASRFLAQLIDLSILGVLLVVVIVGAISAGTMAGGSSQLAIIVFSILSFLLLFGYFWGQEALWSGQTVGKRALRLRVVGDAGQPLTFTQAAIRNLVRIIDFLPAYYGLGLVVLFVNGRGKRLGDLAAGTLVVRDKARISLDQLVRTLPQGYAPAAPTAGFAPLSRTGLPPSVGQSQVPMPASPPAPEPPAPPRLTGPMPSGEVSPQMRRFLVTYAQRRWQLEPGLRAGLAQSVEAGLREALPEVVAAYGPLAALERLADIESGRA